MDDGCVIELFWMAGEFFQIYWSMVSPVYDHKRFVKLDMQVIK